MDHFSIQEVLQSTLYIRDFSLFVSLSLYVFVPDGLSVSLCVVVVFLFFSARRDSSCRLCRYASR